MSAVHDDDHVACARHAKPSGDTDTAGRADTGAGDTGAGDTAPVRLAGLQRSAAEAYAAITLADDALRVFAGRRVTAERALRFAAARHAAAARAAAAHARARPGPLAQLVSRFRARREWGEQRPGLEAALSAAELQLTAARQELSAAKSDFTDRLAARTAAAATLRRLTAECAAVRAEITAASLRGPDESRWDNGWRA